MIAAGTGISCADILTTLQELHMLAYRNRTHVIALAPKLIKEYVDNQTKPMRVIDPALLID